MSRVILYCRVSSAEQATEGVSLDAQEARLRAYCDLYYLEPVAVIRDAGESAKSLKRPGIAQALGMLKAGKADGLVIAKLDRLTRSVADWQCLIDSYFGEKAGKLLFSVNDAIDTRSASGRLVLNVLMSVAAWEREACGERTSVALQHKISKGERCGKIRFGYSLGADGKTLIPSESEQSGITLMQSLRSQGSTYRSIAQQLDAKAIPTKEGGKWTHAAVRRILNRQLVKGAA